MCDLWVVGFRERHPDRWPAGLDDAVVEAALEAFTELPRSADRTVSLITDLHADNVLSAEREPWLAIDPKPYIADPTYDVLQHMLNCRDRLMTDPIGLSTTRAVRCDLDPSRLSRWLLARCVLAAEQWPELAAVVAALQPHVVP